MSNHTIRTKNAFSYVTREINWKINIQELWLLAMKCRLNVLYKCMKCLWNNSNCYQVSEQTRFCDGQTHGQAQGEKQYVSWHFQEGDIIKSLNRENSQRDNKEFQSHVHGKCSTILNTFLFLFSNTMLVICTVYRAIFGRQLVFDIAEHLWYL